MKKVYDLFLKLEDNDHRHKHDDKRRLDGIYQILRDSMMQLNVSETTSRMLLDSGKVDEAEIRKYQDRSAGARIGEEIIKAGYTDTREDDDDWGRTRTISVLVLK